MTHEDANPQPPSWRRTSRVACLLVAICYVCFVNAIPNPFIDYDDQYGIEYNRHVHGISADNIAHAFSAPQKGEWRKAFLPLRDLSIIYDYSILDMRKGGGGYFDGIEQQLHVTNLILHTLNVLLVYFLLSAIGLEQRVTLLGAALFACHPIHVESVTWISGRKDLLSGFFLLSALLIRCHPKARDRLPNLAVMFLFIMACLCKATAIIFPGLVIALDLSRFSGEGDPKQKMRECINDWLPFLAAGLILTLIHAYYAVKGGTTGGSPGPERLLNIIPVYAHYFWQFLFPSHLSLAYPIQLPILSLRVLLAWLVTVWLIHKVVKAGKAHSSPLLLFAWLGVCLLPVSGILMTSTLVADRYFYLPSIAACGLLSIGLVSFIKWNAAARMLAALALLSLAGLTIHRNSLWSDSELLWRNALERSPENTKAQFNLATNYLRKAKPKRAAPLLLQVQENQPDSDDVAVNLAAALAARDEWKEADELCESVLKKNADDMGANLVKGQVLLARGDTEQAGFIFTGVLQKHPNSLEGLVGLARTLEADGAPSRAFPVVNKAVTVAPGSFEALRAFGDISEKLAMPAKAIQAYERARELRPKDPHGSRRLGEIYFKEGNYNFAVINYARLVKIQPNHADNHFRLGHSYLKMNRLPEAIESFTRTLRIEPGHAGAKKVLESLGGSETKR